MPFPDARRPSVTQPGRAILGVALMVLLATRDASGIEMFTYFGDGSRIGLPSLEVPIEAYPGIPLRSDRLRARRRAQVAPGGAVRVGPPGSPRGMTIRALPPEASTPQRRASPRGAVPIAPEPDDILPGGSVPEPRRGR